MIDRQWIVLKSYVIPSKPHRTVVDVVVRRERRTSTLCTPKYQTLVEDDFQTDATTKENDDSILDIRKTRSCLTAPSCQRWPTDACRRSLHGDDELMSLNALRNLFVDAEIWNNLMTWNHDLIAWPWLRIFNILHQVIPNRFKGLWCGGNLPLSDLVGKGEPAQGSSNGLRTIHDLARPPVYGDVHNGRAYSK